MTVYTELLAALSWLCVAGTMQAPYTSVSPAVLEEGASLLTGIPAEVQSILSSLRPRKAALQAKAGLIHNTVYSASLTDSVLLWCPVTQPVALQHSQA